MVLLETLVLDPSAAAASRSPDTFMTIVGVGLTNTSGLSSGKLAVIQMIMGMLYFAFWGQGQAG